MEILYYLISFCIVLFMLIAMYDGIYFHIWKYELHTREESYFEHKTHTIRAILFPLIIWFLFLNQDIFNFWIGMSLVTLDVLILAVDAFSEKDSRKEIGGLPRWEYILHLFANGFHFAAIVLVLATKISITETGLIFNELTTQSPAKDLFDFVSIQAIPGSILIAVIHFILVFPFGIRIWRNLRNKITCC